VNKRKTDVYLLSEKQIKEVLKKHKAYVAKHKHCKYYVIVPDGMCCKCEYDTWEKKNG
jgi:hypothetical protein